MDLGRPPELHLSEGRSITLLDEPTDPKMIEEGLMLLRQIAGMPQPEPGEDLAAGLFTSDNRLGVPNTLHRVSCVRFYNGKIIGLVYRIGKRLPRAVSIIRDLLAECCSKSSSGTPPKSLLVLGRPGSGASPLLCFFLVAGMSSNHKAVYREDDIVEGSEQASCQRTQSACGDCRYDCRDRWRRPGATSMCWQMPQAVRARAIQAIYGDARSRPELQP